MKTVPIGYPDYFAFANFFNPYYASFCGGWFGIGFIPVERYFAKAYASGYSRNSSSYYFYNASPKSYGFSAPCGFYYYHGPACLVAFFFSYASSKAGCSLSKTFAEGGARPSGASV